MLVLLTGATGFIGSHLAPALLAQGHRVVAAGRKPCADPRIGFIEADLSHDTEISLWLARLRGVDVVVNAVGIFHESGTQTFAALHSAGPRALFAACADTGVRFVVQVSALGADAGARTAYHLSKREADDFLASLPVRSCIVQPSLVYGADGASARLFRTLATMPFVLRFGRAAQSVQPVHIDDVVAAIVELIDTAAPPAPGHADPDTGAAAGGALAAGARAGTGHDAGRQGWRLALAGPQAMEFTAYLAALRHAMGLGKLRVLPLPDWLARALAQLAAKLPGSPLSPAALDMLARGNSADPHQLTELLGRPPIGVEQFIRRPRTERRIAQLGWLQPMLRVSIAIVWIWTAIVSAFVYPVQDSYALLSRSGIPAVLAPLMLYGAAALDLAFGLATVALPRRWRRPFWLGQLALIALYSVLIAWRLPEFLSHPYGPLSKNLPMLAAIWMLYELERD